MHAAAVELRLHIPPAVPTMALAKQCAALPLALTLPLTLSLPLPLTLALPLTLPLAKQCAAAAQG